MYCLSVAAGVRLVMRVVVDLYVSVEHVCVSVAYECIVCMVKRSGVLV